MNIFLDFLKTSLKKKIFVPSAFARSSRKMSTIEIENIRIKDEERREKNVADVFNSTRLDFRKLENLGKKRGETFFDQINEKNAQIERKLFDEQLKDIQFLSLLNFFF